MRGSMIVACLLAGMAAGAEEWTEARVRGLERRVLETVADLALVPPKLITSPGPEYGAANERWAMNNGLPCRMKCICGIFSLLRIID